MGGASAAIYYTELAAAAGRHAHHPRRHGRRARQPGCGMGDTVVAVSATSDDPMVDIFTHGDPHAPTADWRLVELASAAGSRARRPVHVGPIVTSAVFYDTRPGIMKRWKDRGHLAIEMEAAILYTLGAYHGLRGPDVGDDQRPDRRRRRHRAHQRCRAEGRRRQDDGGRLRRRHRRVCDANLGGPGRLSRSVLPRMRWGSDEAELLHGVALLGRARRPMRRSCRGE